MTRYNFDQIVDRRGTDSVKWGSVPEGVTPMWVADMDFRSAEPIVDALRGRVEHGVFGYTQPASALKHALRARMQSLYGWDVKEQEITFLPGIVTGLNIVFQTFAGPGDSIVAQPPVYFHFLRDPVRHGRALIDPPLVRKGDSYEIDFDRFEKAITGRTRVFVLCNPHNPVGRVYTRAELERLAEICLRHRLIICADEIHCELVYPGFRHVPIAGLSPEIAASTVTLMAPSKTYNLAGLDCAYAIISNSGLRAMWQNTSYGIIPGVNIMGQAAALAALAGGQEWLEQVIDYLQGNRDFIVDFIRKKMPGLQVCRMEATYLAWIDCSKSGIPGSAAEFFLKQARVALQDGADFGKGGEGYVRLNFACPRQVLADVLGRMQSALSSL